MHTQNLTSLTFSSPLGTATLFPSRSLEDNASTVARPCFAQGRARGKCEGESFSRCGLVLLLALLLRSSPSMTSLSFRGCLSFTRQLTPR
jgi:hypothetical protein